MSDGGFIETVLGFVQDGSWARRKLGSGLPRLT